MVKIDGIPKATRLKRERPRFSTREDAEIGKEWFEKQTNNEYIVVKNPSGNDYFLRLKRGSKKY
ncbi:hypothetical protein KAU11_09480 [Candidatus Babeliales bacterium]|nr:hypothetical protein [Candidatus Babeliales bacterium]